MFIEEKVDMTEIIEENIETTIGDMTVEEIIVITDEKVMIDETMTGEMTITEETIIEEMIIKEEMSIEIDTIDLVTEHMVTELIEKFIRILAVYSWEIFLFITDKKISKNFSQLLVQLLM